MTETEAYDFVARWIDEHQDDFGVRASREDLLALMQDPAELQSRLVAEAVRMTIAATGALIAENDRRWEARLRQAGLKL